MNWILADVKELRNVENPFTFVGIIIVFVVVLIYQNASGSKREKKTVQSYLALKAKAVDVLKGISESDLEKIRNGEKESLNVKYKDAAFDFEEFCIRFWNDKYDKLTVYKESKEDIDDRLKEIVLGLAEEKDEVEEFFDWFEKEAAFHKREELGRHMLFKDNSDKEE